MKTILSFFVLCAALVAQSSPRLDQLRVIPPPTDTSLLVLVMENGKWTAKPLKIGGNVIVDLQAGTIDARYLNQAAHFVTNFYKLTGPDDGFTLTDAPFEPTLATMTVILNGIVLAEGEDYQVDGPGKLVRILPEKHPTKAGDIVQIKYLRKF